MLPLSRLLDLFFHVASLEKFIEFAQSCGAVDTSLLNCSIEVQWPTYGHERVFEASVSILFDNSA